MRGSAARLVALLMPGVGLAAIALLAGNLGLDPAVGWGVKRVALLAAGLGLALAGGAYWRHTDKVFATVSRLQGWVETWLPASWLSPRRAYGAAAWIEIFGRLLPVLTVVLVAYTWFASSGTFISWESPTRYFADLARGFARGHFYLPTQEERYDYSFFGGSYYLYFGPVPATILLLLRSVLPGRVGDLQLTFAFVTGTFAVQCSLALIIWHRLSRDWPGYLLSTSILVMGLASPTTFLLGNYIGGRVYEAAIAGG